ncbi:hypothetical protein [Tenacibaculum retecalamus]|uniref:hypothetical protein n=1 Tax=Tenacibaculum retecalamus TaxID=3018315 RepID=UPI0023D92739|nr:hypothetical protein [Tenacibaculum retecalamus]WBX70447.1 hypothetical protein PG912_09205 [Tenacibaculum retecalamus]
MCRNNWNKEKLQYNKENKLKHSLTTLMIIIIISSMNAQLELESFIDIGENNVSEGVYIKNAYRGNYQYKKYNIETGIQFDLKSRNPNTLTGFDIIGSRKFFIKNFSFDVKGFFMLNRFSDLLYETNYGIRLETKKLKHILFEIGTNFKTYTINSKARKKYNIDKSNSKLHEDYIVMYLLTVFLKNHDSDWNVGFSVTNFDYYAIDQLVHPRINLQMKYKIKPNLTLYLDSWYRRSGIFNISANHFGYFFRGGIKWKI